MKKRVFFILFMLSIATVSILARIGLEKNFDTAINRELSNRCIYIINDAVRYALAENSDIADMVTIEKNSLGVISYISADSLILNEFSMDVMDVLEDEIGGLGKIQLKIPVGNLLLSKMLSGRGPSVVLEAYPVGGIRAEFYPYLKDAGINQVLFHMDLDVSVRMETVFGFKHYIQDIRHTVPVCDIIIVGDVPETYANLPSETEFLNLLP